MICLVLVVQKLFRLWMDADNNFISAKPGLKGCRRRLRVLDDHCHYSQRIFLPPILMFLKSLSEVHVADSVATNKDKISTYLEHIKQQNNSSLSMESLDGTFNYRNKDCTRIKKAYNAAVVDDAESITSTNGIVGFDCGNGEREGGGRLDPLGLVEVVLDLVCMGAAEDEDLLNTNRLQPHQRVLNHRHVHQR